MTSDIRKSWRADAVRIVEELFPCTPADSWDLLLDLRDQLLLGDWNRALDTFLACREKLEAEHYLPFYRLRRLLAESLHLETISGAEAQVAPLRQILRRKHRSLADIKRAFRREIFEHDLGPEKALQLRIVEKI